MDTVNEIDGQEQPQKRGKSILDKLWSFSNKGLRVTYGHFKAVKKQADAVGADDVSADLDRYIAAVKAEADKRKCRVE